jgi:hypothetical protein
MADLGPLPLFETAQDARRYVRAAMAMALAAGLAVVAVIAWLLFGSQAGAAGLLIALGFALAGQIIYLVLCVQVWERHRPNDRWDWRSARAFHEGSITTTLRHARQVAAHE